MNWRGSNWLGTAIGAVVGLIATRSFLGMCLGALFGRAVEAMLVGTRPVRRAPNFLEPLFGLIGAMAKADGRVSSEEIVATERLMQRMCLEPAQRREAIARFNAGKERGFAVNAAIADLRAWCDGRRDHAYILIDVLLDVVYAGDNADARLAVLRRLTLSLGIDDRELAALAAMRGEAWQSRWAGAQGHQRNAPPPPPGTAVPDPYTVLGVAPNADERAVKHAYRKLMSEHHPDKLGDVPDVLRRRAEERAREINAAYERIKSARRFK